MSEVGIDVACERMTSATRANALALLGAFLGDDEHYRASAVVYGDGGHEALERALDLFLHRPEIGFVWLAYAGERREAVGVCVASYAISTSRGALVVKLDDVHIARDWQGRGVGRAMLATLFDELRRSGVTRVDCGCHRGNTGAWRFYEGLGFRPLNEERIACLV